MGKPHRCTLLFFLAISSNSLAGQADITAVSVTLEKARTYTFEVTILHNDEGWDHYADSWEIRDENGTLYGTRTLHHPHVSEQPFTRRLSHVKIPEGVSTVTVRAHDSIHLYGGKTITVELP